MIKWLKFRPGTKVRVLHDPPGSISPGHFVDQVGTVVRREVGPYSILVRVDFHGPIDLHFPLNSLDVIIK